MRYECGYEWVPLLHPLGSYGSLVDRRLGPLPKRRLVCRLWWLVSVELRRFHSKGPGAPWTVTIIVESSQVNNI
jgi:hypothetical protein